ncbi:hypothetical protein T492DRAFT_1061950 [Pavlovales sp. CCMP2436]|nr:hypothetical protein T492DRAFT_1061950 [Pavlovales sp. CCMP2436]
MRRLLLLAALAVFGLAAGAESPICHDTFPMPSASARPEVACRLVIVRHIVKCAGTTMRGVWERLSLATLDWHTQSVFPAPMHHCFFGAMKRRREVITKYLACATGSLSQRVQAAIEYHVSTDGSTILAADLRLLHSVPRAPSQHRVVVIALVREPRSWFASVYRYQLVYRYKRVDMKEYVLRAQSPQLGHLLGGSGFLTNRSAGWTRHDKGLPEMHPYEGRFVRPEFPNAQAVLAAFDVLGTMAKFSEAVFLTCHLTGLPSCPHFARQWESQATSAKPGKMAPVKKDVPKGPWPFYEEAEVAEILALIETHAGADRWLYELAGDRIRRDIEALEPTVASALSAYARRQDSLIADKVITGETACQALRVWNSTAERGCRFGLTAEGRAVQQATQIPPGSTVWDAE